MNQYGILHREKVNKRLAAIIAVIFFILAFAVNCSGQQCPDKPMRFTTDSGAVYISIIKDGDVYKLFSYAYNDHTDFTFRIGFLNGDIVSFPVIVTRNGRRYKEYAVSPAMLKRLKTEKFDVLFLDSDRDSYVCSTIITKDHFINFLTNKP